MSTERGHPRAGHHISQRVNHLHYPLTYNEDAIGIRENTRGVASASVGDCDKFLCEGCGLLSRGLVLGRNVGVRSEIAQQVKILLVLAAFTRLLKPDGWDRAIMTDGVRG